MTHQRCTGCGRVLLWVHGSLRCCNANCTNPSPAAPGVAPGSSPTTAGTGDDPTWGVNDHAALTDVQRALDHFPLRDREGRNVGA